MRSFNYVYFSRLALPVLLVVVCKFAFAADDVVTFESFYRTGFTVNWLVNGIGAVLVGLLVFWGWPVLAPSIVAVIGSIGTTVGGIFGFSGVAATNFGLALLGGGAVASGGFGVVGGTALLAAALTFGTDVTLDYAVGALSQKYDEKKFSEASLKMITLPLPINTSGSNFLKQAGDTLKSDTGSDAWYCLKKYPNNIADFKTCLAEVGKTQKERIDRTLTILRMNQKENSREPLARDTTMRALLEFLSNAYHGAQKSALIAYEVARKTGNPPTLPAFIYACSLLYNELPNLNESFDKFQYAVVGEPKNMLTPILFATYLDRLSYRLNDRTDGVDQFARLSQLAGSLSADQRKLAIQQSLISYVFIQVYVAQQRVLSLVRSKNTTVRKNPKILSKVTGAIEDYEKLLTISTDLIARQGDLLDLLADDSSWWETVKQGKNPLKKSGLAPYRYTQVEYGMLPTPQILNKDTDELGRI